MVTAQYLINNCEQHGVIHWKALREKVQRDRELGARKGEYKSWPFQIHKHQNQALLGESNSSTIIRGAINSRQGKDTRKDYPRFFTSLKPFTGFNLIKSGISRPCRDNIQIKPREDNK